MYANLISLKEDQDKNAADQQIYPRSQSCILFILGFLMFTSQTVTKENRLGLRLHWL